MKRALLAFAAAAVLGWTGHVMAGEDTFALGWNGATEVAPGTTGETYISTLEHTGPGPGSQGWSLSIAARDCTITAITFGGTDGETQFAGGFSQGGPNASDGADDGAVIAVVLCFGCPNVVPPEATINAITVDFPDSPGTSMLLYKDGLQGAGQPVDNIITQEGQSFVPTVTDLEIVRPEGPAETFILGWEGPDEVSSGATGETYISTLTHENPAGPGSQGWSLSIAARGCTITDITFGGTDGETQFSGGFSQGGPDASDGEDDGAVIAVVLCFGCPNVVPTEATINAISVDFPTVKSDAPFSLLYKDGLEGAGQPVENVITQEGNSFIPVKSDFNGTVKAVAPLNSFIRGNANDDGKVNIADPIWIVSELFRSGEESPCQDAADANDNGMVELGDAVLLIEFLFAGGSTPPAPFSSDPQSTRLDVADCGTDPDGDEDGLSCAGSSFCP